MRAQSKISIAALIVLASSSALPGQTASDEPPQAGRLPGFSHVVGTYRISFRAEPTEVIVEDPITVTIRITGKGPKKYQPKRGLLQPFKDEVLFDFYIEPVPDQDRVIPGRKDEQTWVFVYRLRPRSTAVKEVPEPRLVYYQPRAGYRTTYPDAEPIPLTVKPRPQFNADAMGTHNIGQVPERIYHQVSGPKVLARAEPASYWNPPVLIAVGLGLPLLSWLGFIAGRRLFPDDTRQQQRRRSQAARRAVRELGRVKEDVSIEVVAKTLTGYLGERLDMPATEPTPLEVDRFLKRRGVAGAVRRRWAQFFENFDKMRCTLAPLQVPCATNPGPPRR